jgi:hypothetical protein
MRHHLQIILFAMSMNYLDARLALLFVRFNLAKHIVTESINFTKSVAPQCTVTASNG